MNGSAPKCSKTGSHVEVQRKDHPNVTTERHDVRTNESAMSPVMTKTDRANPSAVARKPKSPMRRRSRAADDTATPAPRTGVDEGTGATTRLGTGIRKRGARTTSIG